MNSGSTRPMFGSVVLQRIMDSSWPRNLGLKGSGIDWGNVQKRHPFCAPFIKISKEKISGVPGAGNQWCQPQISKFLRFIILTTRIAAEIVTELCTQSATHSYAKVMTRNDQGKHRGLAGPTRLTQNKACRVFGTCCNVTSILVHVLWMFYGYMVGKSIPWILRIHGLSGVNPPKLKEGQTHSPPSSPNESVRDVRVANLHVFGTKLWEETHLRHPQPLKDHVAQRPFGTKDKGRWSDQHRKGHVAKGV